MAAVVSALDNLGCKSRIPKPWADEMAIEKAANFGSLPDCMAGAQCIQGLDYCTQTVGDTVLGAIAIASSQTAEGCR